MNKKPYISDKNGQLNLPLETEDLVCSDSTILEGVTTSKTTVIDFCKAFNDDELRREIARKQQAAWARKIIKKSEDEDLLEM